jgi:hypothetical protein
MRLNVLITGLRKAAVAMALLVVAAVAPRAQAGLVITPTFTANFVTNFGANAAAAENAWIAAANIYESTFTNNAHINITVDAVAGTGVFGESSTALQSISYANLRAAVVANAKSPDQLTSIGPGGSVTAADPTGGAGTFWLTTSQAKALGVTPDNMNNDGTTTFGAGNPFTFSGPIAPGTFDFEGVAAHEISEVMGRLGLKGGTIGGLPNSESLLDLFSFTGPGARSLTQGPNANFSIDDGTTLLKLYNNPLANGLDSRDWAPGTNDAFNQFSDSGVVNPVSAVDIRELNVIGYDLPVPVATPEPASLTLLGLGVAGIAGYGWRRRRA